MNEMARRLLSSRIQARVAEIRREKQERGVYPTHALLSELRRSFRDVAAGDLDGTVNELREKGYIRTGRTLNDCWVEAADHGGE